MVALAILGTLLVPWILTLDRHGRTTGWTYALFTVIAFIILKLGLTR